MRDFIIQSFICDRCPTMPPSDDPNKPPSTSRFIGTVEQALSLGWRQINGRLFCPECREANKE